MDGKLGAVSVPNILRTDESPDLSLYAFLAQVGIGHTRLRRLKAGRNSRVWQVESPTGPYIVKEYFHHPGDPRDRLATEWGFLVFLHEHGMAEVPRPLARQEATRRALYSYLPGAPVGTIRAAHIDQAAAFIQRINRWARTESAQRLPSASEACFSLSEHLQRVELRIRSLEETLADARDAVHDAARRLVTDELRPTFKRLAHSLQAHFTASDMDRVLDISQRILSPSDFGFHNALESDAQLAFLDFEYAGWDDPAKLLCDFASQPERPISPAQAIAFWERLRGEGAWDAACGERTEALLPLHRLKWCCILLNEFRTQDRQRRRHAGHRPSDLLHAQLSKARDYFTLHLRDD